MAYSERDQALDLLKIIALITMVIDHMRYVLPEYQNFLITLGRWAFPLFAFIIAKNTYTSIVNNQPNTLKRYFFNFLIFGLGSELPYRLLNGLAGDIKTINIIPTLLIGFLIIIIFNKKYQILYRLILIVIFVGLLWILDSYLEYGASGVLLIVSFFYYLSTKSTFGKNLLFILCVLLAVTSNLQYLIPVIKLYGFFNIYTLPITISVLFVMLLIRFYNKLDLNLNIQTIGKGFWWFYPIHMLVIFGISKII